MSNKKRYEPSREEREKIVQHAVANMKFPKEQAASELDNLMARVQAAIKRVHTLAKPIAESQIATGAIHTPQGRKNFKQTLHKFFCDEFKEFDKDELIFITSLVHAEIVSDNFV